MSAAILVVLTKASSESWKSTTILHYKCLSIGHCTLHHCDCRIQQSFREQKYESQSTVHGRSRCLLPSDCPSITPSPGLEYAPAGSSDSECPSRCKHYSFPQTIKLRFQQFSLSLLYFSPHHTTSCHTYLSECLSHTSPPHSSPTALISFLYPLQRSASHPSPPLPPSSTRPSRFTASRAIQF